MIEEILQKLSKIRKPEKVVDQLIEGALQLTESNIGYFAVLNQSGDVITMLGWSRLVRDLCDMLHKPILYPLEDTGLWGDCIREGKPIITNDYESSTRPTKKGLPKDHVMVVRHLNVPVMEGGRKVGILGVGNKPGLYTSEDADTLQEYANRAWVIIHALLPETAE